MNSVILCEGKTDAILLSYYLEKVCDWKYNAHAPSKINIVVDKENQMVNWYKKGNDNLLIFAVGGKDGFEEAYNRSIRHILLNYDVTNGFAKLIVIRDKDDETTEQALSSVNSSTGFSFENYNWTDSTYKNNFDMEDTIELLSLIIPNEKQGALENVLLDAISEKEYEKNIVEQSSRFVDSFGSTADKYIKSNRLKLKAKLSTTLSILSPDHVFTTINEFLISVDWERYEIIEDTFGLLKKI